MALNLLNVSENFKKIQKSNAFSSIYDFMKLEKRKKQMIFFGFGFEISKKTVSVRFSLSTKFRFRLVKKYRLTGFSVNRPFPSIITASEVVESL